MSTTTDVFLDTRTATTPLIAPSRPTKRFCCVTQHDNVEEALEQVSDLSNIGNVILGGFSAISSLVILVISSSEVDSDITKNIALGLSSFQVLCAILYVGWIKVFIYCLYPREIEVQLMSVLTDSGISKYLQEKAQHETTKRIVMEEDNLDEIRTRIQNRT